MMMMMMMMMMMIDDDNKDDNDNNNDDDFRLSTLERHLPIFLSSLLIIDMHTYTIIRILRVFCVLQDTVLTIRRVEK